MVKKVLLISAILYTIALVIITFINLNNVPDLGSSFDDKIYHVLAYALLSYLWCGYFKMTNSTAKKRTVVLVLIGFGIALEAAQQQINPNRTTDIIDMVSNCIGVFIGTILVRYLNIFKLNIF